MDELSEYLLQHYPNNYITGNQDCNLLIWGAKGEVRHKPQMCTLNVGFEYDPYALPKEDIINCLNGEIQDNFAFRKLLNYGTMFAQRMDLPFMIIVYPSLRREYNDCWEKSKSRYDTEQVQFYCVESNIPKDGSIVNGSGLRSMIYANLHCSYSDKGTSKDKNKRLADYFHMWSRDSLTRYITKFDLDGFIVNAQSGKDVLVEFKRSTKNPWIPNWYPKYDKPDYILQYTFAQMIGADFWLLHHEQRVPLEEGRVSFFDIKEIDESQSEYFLHFKKRVMQLPLHGDISLDSIIHSHLSAQNNNDNSLCCPLCGGKIKHGRYGYYCERKSSGECDMAVGRYYSDELPLDVISSLIAGIPAAYTSSNGRKTTLSPKIEVNTYNDTTSHRWKKRIIPAAHVIS